MARRLTWTESALQDLESIAEYLSRDSPRYAAVVAREVQAATRSLLNFPERGRVVPELDLADVRELQVRRYRLIYRLSPDAVFIVRLIHGARDLIPLWEHGAGEHEDPPPGL